MARILYGPLVTEVFGSIGGVTFQKNSSGSIIRSRPTLAHSSTPRQQQAHAYHQKYLLAWQDLTQANRDLWNTYATTWTKTNKFGQVKKLTGQNWFESVNYQLETGGQPFTSAPPPHDLPAEPPSFTLTANGTSLNLTTTSVYNNVRGRLSVWVSLPTRRNTLSLNQIRKKAGYIIPTIAIANNITSAWETATGLTWNPGLFFPDANIFVCLQNMRKSSGITSAYLCSKINVTGIPPEIDNLLWDSGDNAQADQGEIIQADQQ